jgi:hypothetical protein
MARSKDGGILSLPNVKWNKKKFLFQGFHRHYVRMVLYLGLTVFSFTYSYYNSFNPRCKIFPIQILLVLFKQGIQRTNSECVFVALRIQHKMHTHNSVMWPLQLYNSFPYYLINDTIFERKKLWTTKCVLIFSRTSAQNISHSKRNVARYDRYMYWSSRVPIILVGF